LYKLQILLKAKISISHSWFPIPMAVRNLTSHSHIWLSMFFEHWSAGCIITDISLLCATALKMMLINMLPLCSLCSMPKRCGPLAFEISWKKYRTKKRRRRAKSQSPYASFGESHPFDLYVYFGQPTLWKHYISRVSARLDTHRKLISTCISHTHIAFCSQL
jgi:hypothetical protein